MAENPQATPTPSAQHTAPNATPAGPQRADSAKREGLRSILSTLAILAIAPIVAILLTAFVFQSYQVDGPSMETTLHDNDRLIVWKLPKTWARITGHPFVPRRGDVVVFTEPKLAQFGQDPSKQLIKRVIGLPGERVVVKDNVLTVYNQEHPDGFQPDATLPYGNVIISTPVDGEWTVGKDQLFVSGDNRPNSLDSRFFGPISAQNIIGKLVIRVLPVDKMKKF
jgi:signal peptidase I